jgi:uncharacterized protein (TIGR02646 family)
MRPFTRGPAPPILLEVAPAATKRFVTRRQKNPAAEFSWPRRKKQSIASTIVEALEPLTDAHCSYCDGFPIDALARKEIDHFEPKTRAPHLVLEWTNLYLGCTACNGAKGETWDAALLRPDDPSFSFAAFFLVDELTGRLVPNPAASEEDRRRADVTIKCFALQRPGLCSLRAQEVRCRAIGTPADPTRPYRFV